MPSFKFKFTTEFPAKRLEHSKSYMLYYSQFIGFDATLDLKCDRTRQMSALQALHINALRYCTTAIGSPIIHYVEPYSESAGARDTDKLDVSR